jgi:transposase
MEAVMADATNKQTTDAQPAVLVAIELSRASWLLAVYDSTTDKISRRRIAGGDAAGLIALIEEARHRAGHRADGPVEAECVFEAGYDGFWLARHLRVTGIGCRVMDPASLKVDRRARRVKTDRVDAESLLRALQAWRRGDRHACRFVRVPDVAEEDARRPHRELNRLKKERVGHVNRIKGLLALHGVRDYQPLHQDRRRAFAALSAWDGAPLLSHGRREIERELARLELVLEQIAEIEDGLAATTAGTEDAIITLEALVCVGRETAADDYTTSKGSARPATRSCAPASSSSPGDGSASNMAARSRLGSGPRRSAPAGVPSASPSSRSPGSSRSRFGGWPHLASCPMAPGSGRRRAAD